MTERKISKFPDYFKFDFDLGKVLNYPFQLFLIQAISTPFERLQVLKQCEQSIQQFKHSLSPSRASPALLKTATTSYPALISGVLNRNHRFRAIPTLQRPSNQRLPVNFQGLPKRPLLFGHLRLDQSSLIHQINRKRQKQVPG